MTNKKPFFKTIVVSFNFDGNSFDLTKITPEYMLRVLRDKGLENYGVTLDAKVEDEYSD